MRLLVTRPIEQARAAVAELRAHGVDAVALPLIAIEPIDAAADAAAWARLQRCWQTLAARRLVMFVSANAVAQFFAAAPGGCTWPAATLAGSTGPGTSAALLAAGVPPGNLRAPAAGAPRLDSEALWQVLRLQPWVGASVLIVRGEGGREWLGETLRAAGADVEMIAAYRRILPRHDAAQAAVLAAAEANPAAHAWHFSSSEAVLQLPRLTTSRAWRVSLAWATHPRIGEAARAAGFTDVRLLAPGLEALLTAWREHAAGALAPLQSGETDGAAPLRGGAPGRS